MTDDEIRGAEITVGSPWWDLPNFIITTVTEVAASAIEARLEFRTKGEGTLLASLATDGGGTADGTITITSLGGEAQSWLYEAECVLPAAITATLEPSVDATTSALQQAGVGNLVIWTATVLSGEPIPTHDYALRIKPQITEVP